MSGANGVAPIATLIFGVIFLIFGLILSGPILDQGQLNGALGIHNTLAEMMHSDPGAQKSCECVFDFPRCFEHRVLVVDQALLKTGVFDTHAVAQPAVVQERPGEGQAR